MHYVNWNIADYASHTAHLSPLEDVAYRRMLDCYYLHERPLGRNATVIAREIRMPEHVAEVRSVLSQFFERNASGYTNKRAEEEIARYRTKVQQASDAGRASAERRFNRRSTDVEPTNPKNQPQEPVPPLPLHSEGRGGVDSDPPKPEPGDPVVELQLALSKLGLRSNLRGLDRSRQLMALAEKAAATGLTVARVAALWPLAEDQAKAREDGDPRALLSHWLEEGIWREVLDIEGRKAKERDAAGRARTSGDPMEGVYGA